jgi:hypothetical protein
MISILTEKQLATIRGFGTAEFEAEGLIMIQQYLSELPAIIFGVVTLIWIVGTLGLLNR